MVAQVGSATNMAHKAFALLCVMFTAGLASERDTCPAGSKDCQQDVSGLLQRKAETARTVIEAAKLKPVYHRGTRLPASLLQKLVVQQDAPGNVTVHSKSENVLEKEGEAGVVLGEGKSAEELEKEAQNGGSVNTTNTLNVINKNSEHMTPEEAARNGLLTTVEDIAKVTGVDGEDESCVSGTGGTECFQGDMVPTDDKQLRLFQTMAELGVNKLNGQYAGLLWTGGQVNYCYASDVSDEMKDLMDGAMAQISSAVPCIKFTNIGNPGNWASGASDAKKTCASTPSVFIQSKAAGCFAYVGMLSPTHLYVYNLGANILNMQDPACFSIGIGIHEMLHALAVAHEQSRPDRNQYVQIQWDNIKAGKEHNFDVDSKAVTSLSYDYLSIMQYSPKAFSTNGQATIVDKSGKHSGEMGQRVGMTANDAEQLAAMYSCTAKTTTGKTGCLDTGSTNCDALKTCGSGDSMDDCCACGAGVEYQCWEGSECRQVSELPMDPVEDHGSCLADKSALFGGAYGCVLQSSCTYEVQIRCADSPGQYMNFPKANSYYICALDQVCSDKSKCTFTKA